MAKDEDYETDNSERPVGGYSKPGNDFGNHGNYNGHWVPPWWWPKQPKWFKKPKWPKWPKKTKKYK